MTSEGANEPNRKNRLSEAGIRPCRVRGETTLRMSFVGTEEQSSSSSGNGNGSLPIELEPSPSSLSVGGGASRQQQLQQQLEQVNR